MINNHYLYILYVLSVLGFFTLFIYEYVKKTEENTNEIEPQPSHNLCPDPLTFDSYFDYADKLKEKINPANLEGFWKDESNVDLPDSSYS